MKRTGRAALVAAAGFLLAAAAHAETTTVTVIDKLSDGQQEETIAVFIRGRLAGTLHITAAHPEDEFTATIERAADTPYTLCGRLLRREADGSLSSHPIDNGGVLGDVAGQTLFANTMEDVLFSLVPLLGGPRGEVHEGPACAAAVS